ncbi:MAG: 50S ribosomal protein L4 [Dehalococcoidia bacterium]
MKLPVVDATGKQLREIDASDEVFGIEPNVAVMHQAYVAQMANRRAGTASTKRRGEVSGSTAKLRRQKGLGRARMGSNRSNSRVGGGVAHGPKPRSFAKDLPRQMKRLALRSALSSHAASGEIVVVDGLVPEEPKTRNVFATLQAVGVKRRALLVSGAHEPNLVRASRNIPNVKTVPAANLNVVDVVNAHHLVMTEDAVRAIEGLWGGENARPARGRVEEAG